MRLLCLHGYMQSASLFRERTGSLRTALAKQQVSFDYVDAPFVLTGTDLFGGAGAEGESREQPRGWWRAGENSTPGGEWVRPSLSALAAGAQESLELVRAHAAANGPYDGVFGFSQGAALAGLLLATDPFLFRFAVLVAGFVPNDPALSGLYSAAPLPYPVLSVSGETDVLVPRERVLLLASKFDPNRAVCFTHSGGHGVPSNAAFRTALKEFLSAQAAGRSAA